MLPEVIRIQAKRLMILNQNDFFLTQQVQEKDIFIN